MKTYTKDQYAAACAEVADHLHWRFTYLENHPDEKASATRWCVENGVSAAGFANLCLLIAFPELYRLDTEQKQILFALGAGPARSEDDGDDLPF